jgi:hypothetical protein
MSALAVRTLSPPNRWRSIEFFAANVARLSQRTAADSAHNTSGRSESPDAPGYLAIA